MANRIIKPDSGNTLVLQDEGGSAALTIDTSGNTTLAGTSNNIGTVTSGTFNGTIGTSASGSANLPAVKTALNASGSAPIYACRAWVNFNGTTGSGTGHSDMTINASGNVSSITDNGTGDYTVNFTTSMPDTNYSTVGMVLNNSYGTASDSSSRTLQVNQFSVAVGSIRLLSKFVNSSASGQEDEHGVFVAVFR